MKRFSLLFALLCLAQPAWAGWQTTRWGGSPAEVARALGVKFPAGDPHPANPDNGHTYAVAHYKAGQFQFSAAFEFTASKLTGVHLSLVSGKSAGCSALAASLVTKYGKPAEEQMGNPTRRAWRDPAHDNSVELVTYTDTFCTVDYTPLSTPTTRGL